MGLLTTHAEIDELPGGIIRQTQHMRRMAYREDGVLKRTFCDWEQGDASRPHVVTRAPFLVSVAPDGHRRIHPTREMDRYCEFGAPYVKPATNWTKVNFGGAARSGSVITWSRAEADLIVTMAGHYVKLEILLKGGYVPPNGQFAFPVGLAGLTRSGGTIFADGVPVMALRQPIVYDRTNPLDARPITSVFVNVSGQWYAVFTLPALAGMAEPVVDPTLTLQPGAGDGIDTYTYESTPTTNYGTADAIRVKEWAGSGARGLIKFDLSSLPAAGIVNSVVLSLYVVGNLNRTDTFRWARLLVANDGWTEGGATWNKKDGSNDWAGSAGPSTSGTDYSPTDIGTFVHTADSPVGTELPSTFNLDEFALLRANNYGLHLRASTSDNDLVAGSSDNATAGYRPKLVVEYTVPATAMVRPRMWGRFA